MIGCWTMRTSCFWSCAAAVITIRFDRDRPNPRFAEQNLLDCRTRSKNSRRKLKALEVAEQRRFLKELQVPQRRLSTITFHECTIAEVRNGARGRSSACSVTWKLAHLQSNTAAASAAPAARRCLPLCADLNSSDRQKRKQKAMKSELPNLQGAMNRPT